jgi:hypothetical protein
MGIYQLLSIYQGDAAEDVLCEECEPSRGWGWELTDEERDYVDWMKGKVALGEAPLPKASNGYEVKGKCPECGGNGRMPVPFSEVW